jgi:glutathione S-transferase
MAYVALVTLLLLLQYIVFTGLVGKARIDYGIKAPATSGHELFERAYRIQENTLESLIVTLPALWLCAEFFSPLVAAALGLVFFIGRILYRAGYMADPEKRGPGFGIGFLANIGLIGCAAWGAIGVL